jgi:NTE family protein
VLQPGPCGSRGRLEARRDRHLNDGLNPPFLTGIPHPIGENIAQFEATGTKTLWIKADPPNVNLMNPDEIAPALRAGYDRAKQEAGGIKSFWS